MLVRALGVSAAVILGIMSPANAATETSPSEVAEAFDLIAYGATPAGIAATLQAKRMGKTALLIEPTDHVGGLTASGLGYTDTGDKSVIGGISHEFYRLIKKHYDNPAVWIHQDRSGFPGYRQADDAMWVFEPKVAESILRKMLADAGVKLVQGSGLDRRPKMGGVVMGGVVKEGRRIEALRLLSGQTYRGRMFIDCSYEGDLLALAGVSSAIGRESNRAYRETLNGFQPYKNLHSHRFVRPVDPFVKPKDAQSGLLFGIERGPYPAEGEQDHRVQAYCFRMCMTKVEANRVDFQKPADYREDHYELLFRNLEAGDLRFPIHPGLMPNGKTDTNNNGAVSTDFIGFSNDYPAASDERRREIIRQHESWQKGLMWTLKHHPRTPNAMREMFRDWGLARDEFTATGHWPHQIYVREARRMVGARLMTERECRGLNPVTDSVGMGSYNMDSHNCTRLVTAEGKVQNEGDIQVSPGGPYSVSYLSLCPKKEECTNLLVPVCLSCSHMAYGSIRMEPVFFVLGQSAGTAACLALDEDIPVQDLNYAKLRARLLQDGQVLQKARPAQAADRQNLPVKLLEGIVIDDSTAVKTGEWVASSSIQGFVGEGYLHDADKNKGDLSIRFETALPRPGNYEVRIYYTPASNRAKNVPVVVEHQGRATAFTIDQRKRPKEGFHSLGVFSFGAKGEVIINNQNTQGHVIADAAQWIQIK